MAEFQYQGVDRAGKKVQGKLDVSNENELRMMLRGQGVRPTKITKVGAMNADIGSLLRGGKASKIRTADLALFTRQLETLIGSGIPLVQSLDVLEDQTVDPTLRRIIASTKASVSQGAFLWESLGKYKEAFPRIYIALIRAGEASGAMDKVLNRLAKYLEKADALSKQIKGAMMYPILVVSVGVLVVGGLLVFVIPKFEEFLKQGGQELPAPTAFVINVSHGLADNIWLILGSAIALYFFGKKYFATPEGRAVLHGFLFRAPLFGQLMQKSGVARFTRTMATLLSSGVGLLDAIEICKTTLDNAVMERAMSGIRREVEGGKTLGQTLVRVTVFPRMATQMISIGESTGNMERMLDNVANIYEADVETLVGGMSKLIEPIVLVLLGGSVGGILIAMYLPIFKLAGGGSG